jgi:O-antigen ligase
MITINSVKRFNENNIISKRTNYLTYYLPLILFSFPLFCNELLVQSGLGYLFYVGLAYSVTYAILKVDWRIFQFTQVMNTIYILFIKKVIDVFLNIDITTVYLSDFTFFSYLLFGIMYISYEKRNQLERLLTGVIIAIEIITIVNIFYYPGLELRDIFTINITVSRGRSQFLLGHRNSLYINICFLLVFNEILKYNVHAHLYKKYNSRLIFGVITFLYYALASRSATLLVIVVLMPTVYYALKRWNRIFKVIVYSSILLSLLFVFFDFQSLFSSIIESVLLRSMSLTYRTFLWEIAFNKVLEKPILGWGSANILSEFTNILVAAARVSHSHNFILNILIEGGILGLLCYSILIIYTIKQLNELLKKKTYYMFSSVYVILMFIGSTNGLQFGYILLPFTLIVSAIGIPKSKFNIRR